MKKEIKRNKKVKEKYKLKINKEELKQNIKKFTLKYYYILIVSLPFILIDIITIILGHKKHLYGI